mmetsp:Transcript_29970/g.71973  ORF Transcript_29970/g.71973 Transcript_29970/m.71973 type:complete len:116 (-) Transcript_29970:1493-1840(-)
MHMSSSESSSFKLQNFLNPSRHQLLEDSRISTVTMHPTVAKAMMVASMKIRMLALPVFFTIPSMYFFPTKAPQKQVLKNVTAYVHGTNPAVTNSTATLLDVNTIIVAVVALDTRG